MCTVSYLPVSASDFILTHNRDEASNRHYSGELISKKINEQRIYYPVDKNSNGTWFASSESFSLCLLNGAFEKHKHQPPYKHSRGLVILHFFEFRGIDDFVTNYNFIGIEPFSLIIVEHKNLTLFTCIWDGENVHFNKENAKQAKIWSSCTLYNNEQQAKRKNWFDTWLQKEGEKDILHFHKFQPKDDEGFIINRNNVVSTLCISSLQLIDTKLQFYYEDLLQQKIEKLALN